MKAKTLINQIKPSPIKISWIKGLEKIDVNRPLVILALGVRGAGKSAFLEALAEHYLAKGHIVLDLFGSRSGEGLAWLRSQWVTKLRLPTLIVKGENINIKFQSKPINIDIKNWNELNLKTIESYRIIISASPLYYNINEEFKAVNYIMNQLFKRLGWTKYICIVCRESANLFYSRLKHKENQKFAKAETIYLIREARHHGLALLMDTQKLTAVDIDLRMLCDYIIFKRQGMFTIPRDLWWIYRYIEPSWLQKCHQKYFIIMSNKANLGLGIFQMAKWHKRARENILRALKIKVEKHKAKE
ncbi:MAG: hypothetical protein DRJ21_00235 [Candidatus Methanomethylicota archaeon]|uniref:Uncharacterized protein n=1 Tax=Thermoproteota archaeon TaxID=2056631 RepID=A0A497EVH4_9CREN|nr:MAG: hypothetical protein DRJ21_00235 [Candidatus Verstraetearchaeota archaeon]